MELEKVCVAKLVELRKVMVSCILIEEGGDFIGRVNGGVINNSI